MADKVTLTNSLSLLAGFADEDDRTISIINPIEGITKADIDAIAPKAVGVLIGDKYGAAFTRFKSAKYVEKTLIVHGID